MKPGDLIQLEDGRQGYFQRKLPDGSIEMLVYVVVLAQDSKKAKVVK